MAKNREREVSSTCDAFRDYVTNNISVIVDCVTRDAPAANMKHGASRLVKLSIPGLENFYKIMKWTKLSNFKC